MPVPLRPLFRHIFKAALHVEHNVVASPPPHGSSLADHGSDCCQCLPCWIFECFIWCLIMKHMQTTMSSTGRVYIVEPHRSSKNSGPQSYDSAYMQLKTESWSPRISVWTLTVLARSP